MRNKYEKANQNINCELNNQKSRLAHNQTELAKLIEAMDKLREDIKKCDMTIAQLNADTFLRNIYILQELMIFHNTN